MSLVSNFFGIFKHKDVNEVRDAENNTVDDIEAPLVVQTKQNATSMVRADDFDDSSVEPEEYSVKEDEEEEVEFLEDTHDGGIVVDDGDDMTPIIMDEHEEIVGSETVEKMIEDPMHKNDVVEYPINIRNDDSRDEEEIEIL